MSWIEGVGDEVTVSVIIIAVLCIILVAWISTGIRDIPFIRVVVVQLTRRHTQTERPIESHEDNLLIQQSDSVTEEQANDTVIEPVTQGEVAETDVDDNLNDRTDGSTLKVETETDEAETSNPKEDSVDEEDVAPAAEENLTSTELRQRRLEFYGSSSSKDSGSPVSDKTAESKTSDSETSLKDSASSKERSEGIENKCGYEKRLPDLLSAESEKSRTEETESKQSEHQNESNDDQSAAGETVEEIRVRLKYLNDTQRLVKASPTETIGNFRRKHFPAELSQSKLIRFIFNGQDLRNDNSTLEACNIIDNSVVHCLITQPREQQSQSANLQEEGLFDIGIFMFPLFGILLGIVWYLRFMYRQFFNVTSTLTLGGITFLYVAAFMSSLRANRPHQHLD